MDESSAAFFLFFMWKLFLDQSWKEDTQLGRKLIYDESPNEHTPCLLNWKDLIRFHKFFTIHRCWIFIYLPNLVQCVCVQQLVARTEREVWGNLTNRRAGDLHSKTGPFVFALSDILYSSRKVFPLFSHFQSPPPVKMFHWRQEPGI